MLAYPVRMDRRLLLVHAHPDDECIATGATMAKYADAGAQVTLVTCTLGEEGEVLLPELISECEKWRKIAIEERSMQIQFFMNDDVNMMRDAWQLVGEDIRKECREQAEKELME